MRSTQGGTLNVFAIHSAVFGGTMLGALGGPNPRSGSCGIKTATTAIQNAARKIIKFAAFAIREKQCKRRLFAVF